MHAIDVNFKALKRINFRSVILNFSSQKFSKFNFTLKYSVTACWNTNTGILYNTIYSIYTVSDYSWLFFPQGDATILAKFQSRVATSIRASCNCQFTEKNILKHSIGLKCHDRISGSLYLRITDVEQYQTEELICIHQLYLTNKKNLASLGEFPRDSFSLLYARYWL